MELSWKRVIIFIDNSAAVAALVRGDSISGIDASLVAVFWRIAREANICIWIDRVLSRLNIPDLPTRRAKIACHGREALSFKNLIHLLPASLSWRVVR